MKGWRIALLCTALGFGLVDAGAAAARGAHQREGHHRAERQVARQHHARPATPRHTPPKRTRHAAGVQHGHASIYASSLAGRRMADGTRFNPHAATVASRTLPLGSRARVTNLKNGRSVTVRVTDRGPRPRHRILDVSPGVAGQLGMGRTGTAPVSVLPLPSVTGRAEAATPPRGGRRG